MQDSNRESLQTVSCPAVAYESYEMESFHRNDEFVRRIP